MGKNFNCIAAFAEVARDRPDLLAISGGGDEITYGELAREGARLAAAIKPGLSSGRVGILGSRSIAAYAGIVGAAWAGATYVPLNLKWPKDRLISLLDRLQLDALVVDHNGAKLMDEEVIAHAPSNMFRADNAIEFAGSVAFSDIEHPPLAEPARRNRQDLAYIMFTSGSTGMPKGVMISQGALAQYISAAESWTCYQPHDRIAEAQDITFDLSVHNMFLAWRVGASLHLMSALDMMAPHAFIRKQKVSAWMSVPTIVNNMRRANRLKAGLLPDLRLSLFCGEPLGIATVRAWAEAAPNSRIENIYGPTEFTIACTRQTAIEPIPVTPQRQMVAIGKPLNGVEVEVWDEGGNPAATGQVGELVLSGPQMACGYFEAPDLTDKSFVQVADKRWYRTGDLGYRDADGLFHHMGRTDNQIKMKGNRIELEEVETHLQKACLSQQAVVVAWPVIDGSPQGLVGFTTSRLRTEDQVKAAMKSSLPEYMIPARIHFCDEMPRNTNDKIDRKALREQLRAPGMETPVCDNVVQPS